MGQYQTQTGESLKVMISQENAAEQLRALLDYYEFELEDFTDNLQRVLQSALKQIERGIMAGRIEVVVSADNCEVKLNLKRPVAGAPNPIVFREISGNCKIGIREDSGDYGKMYSFLGALSGDGIGVIQSLKGKDLSLAEALGAFFLQV